MPETPAPRACLNCATELQGSYCHRCGQKDQHKRLPLKHLLHDVFHDLWHFDTKVLGTLWLLIRHPGFLAAEYLEGRRVRHVPPFRLYVVISFITFALLAMIHIGDGSRSHEKKTQDPAAASEIAKDTGKVQEHEDAPQWAKDLEREARKRAAEAEAQKQDAPDKDGSGKVRKGVNISSNSEFGKDLERRARKAAEDPAAFYRIFMGGLSKIMFLLMPAFAALVFVLHARKGGTYFVDHMVLSLHFHTVAFLTIIGMRGLTLIPMGCWGCLPWAVLILAPPAWLMTALQFLHRRGWFRSVLKTTLLLGIYGIVVGSAMVGVLWYSLPK